MEIRIKVDPIIIPETKKIVLKSFEGLHFCGVLNVVDYDDKVKKAATVYPECIQNGSFVNNQKWSGWNAQWSWIGGNDARFTNSSSNGLIQAAADMLHNIVALTNYVLKFHIVSAGVAHISFYNAATNVTYISGQDYATGDHSVNFTTGADVKLGGFDMWGSSLGNTFDISSISIKQV